MYSSLLQHPPRRLRQIAAIAGRGIQIPPGSAVFYALCVPIANKDSKGNVEWRLVYRSEALKATSNPQWAPLPTDLSLHGSPTEIFISVHICGPEELEHNAENETPLGERGEKYVPGKRLDFISQKELPSSMAVTAVMEEEVLIGSVDESEAQLEAEESVEVGSSYKAKEDDIPNCEKPSCNGAAIFENVVSAEEIKNQLVEALEGILPGNACAAYLFRLDNLLALGTDLASSPATQYFLPNTLLFDFIDGEFGALPWLEGGTLHTDGSATTTTTSTTKINAAPGGSRDTLPTTTSVVISKPPTVATTSMPNLSSLPGSGTETPSSESPTKGAIQSNTASSSSPFLDASSLAGGAAAAAIPGLRNLLMSKLRSGIPSTAVLSGATESSSGTSTPTAIVSTARQIPLTELRQQVDGVVSLQHRIGALSNQCAEARVRVDNILKRQEVARGRWKDLETCEEERKETIRRCSVITRRAEETSQRAAAAEKATLTTSQALVSTLHALQAAHRRITAGEASLEGEEGRGRLEGALRELVARRCLMTAQLGWILRLGPSSIQVLQSPPGGLLDEQLEIQWAGSGIDTAAMSDGSSPSYVIPLPENLDPLTTKNSYYNSTNNGRNTAGAGASGGSLVPQPSGGSALLRHETRLAICGVSLDSAVWRNAFDPGGYEWDAAQDKAASVALGYAALLVDKLAEYLGVPLRYPVQFRGSNSVVLDNYPPTGEWYVFTII